MMMIISQASLMCLSSRIKHATNIHFELEVAWVGLKKMPQFKMEWTLEP
jgi:hypothetical protein